MSDVIFYKIVLEKGFHDGTIFPETFGVGHEMIVNENVYQRMKQSDPESVQLIERIVPNPLKVEKPKKFICSKCGAEFDSLQSLGGHASTVHKKAAPEEPDVSDGEPVAGTS